MKIIRQNVGVDVDGCSLRVCFMMMKSDFSLETKASRKFANNPQGFEQLCAWIERKKEPSIDLRITMEATGVYHENLAYHLHERAIMDVHTEYVIHVVLPNTSKAYFKSLNLKSKTDQIDAAALAQMGLERNLRRWNPRSPQMRELKKLNRERLQLIRVKTMINNQLHAEKSSYHPAEMAIKRYHQRLEIIEGQLQDIEQAIGAKLDQDVALKQRIDNVCTAKGIGLITAVGVVAETDGFALINNRKQLVSYAGYDVVNNESGKNLRGPTKISKKGNSYIRQMLYMPAMSSVQHDEHHQNYYKRIVKKTNIKKKGSVAIQRKLLLLIYALYKNNVPYDPMYNERKREELEPKNIEDTQLKEPALQLAED